MFMQYLNKTIFSQIAAGIMNADKKQAETQLFLHDCMRLSKQVIGAVHRGEINSASKPLKILKQKVADYRRLKNPDKFVDNMVQQEYVEAAALLAFSQKQKLPDSEKLKVAQDAYAGGLCDLSGELVRYGLNKALIADIDEVRRVKDLLDELHDGMQGILVKGELRKKADKIRWDLERISNVLLELQLKHRI